MSRFTSHKLLVEGEQDKRVIPYLLDVHIVWGDSKNEWPTNIVAYDGVDDLLAEGEIETQLKSPGLQALGIIVDANESLDSRWQQVRNRCLTAFPELPQQLPSEGLIAANEDGIRLGVWIMPDNQTSGMLETFLSHLIPDGGDKLWEHTQGQVDEAKKLGAPFKEVHRDKARVHSWLAVQDPPGESLHLAVVQRMFRPDSVNCAAFVEWFIKLYELERR
ncbi:MAG: hypothetical protein IID44_28830 [Planctomycetes bacterium]|nr:hypothetical protein [Planctomycetota bacterium]